MNTNISYEKRIVSLLLFFLVGVTFVPNVNSLSPGLWQYNTQSVITQNGYNITINIDDYYYYPGHTVTFHGRLTNNGTGFYGRVDYYLLNPNGNNIFGGMLYSNSNGYFNITYTISKSPTIGKYNFTVYYDVIHSIRATVSFEVIPSLQIKNITGGLGKVRTSIMNTCDESLYNISWTIFVTGVGGFFTFTDLQTNGTINELNANQTVSIKSGSFMLGLGGLEIWVNAKVNGEEYSIYAQGGIIFCFVLVQHP